MKSKAEYVSDWFAKAANDLKIAACEKIDRDFERLRHVEALTPYAVEVRYADDFYMPTPAEMREAASMARTTWEFVLGKLAALGVNPVRKK